MVLVRLRDAVDHRGRNRIVLHKRPARAIHAVTPNSLILRAPAEQLPNRRARSRDHIDAILGDTDGFHGRRYLVGYFIAITGIITSALILTCFDSTSTVFGAYYWAGAVYACQATFFAWCNDAMRYKDERLRSVVIASMNMGSNAVNAWWSILFYSADFAPRFTKGMWAMIACSIALALWTAGITAMTVREQRRGGQDRDVRVVDLQEKELAVVEG